MPATKTDWLVSAPVTATNAKADTPLFPYLMRLIRGVDLSAAEAAGFFQQLIGPAANPAQMVASVTALTAKGETAEELAGMARVIREAALRVHANAGATDIAGTGSSSAKTFNISTAAAFVAAGAGLAICKQSNRGVTSKCGSIDVLVELGVKPAAEPAMAESSLRGTGLSFLFAPKFHPALRRLGDVRSGLGIRTCLNVLGLISNPASVSRHLIGVWHPSLVKPVAGALSMLGAKRAWVVYGQDGLDEISLAGKTAIGEVSSGRVRNFTVAPSDFGLKSSKGLTGKAMTAKESAAVIRDVLSSRRRDEARSLVVLNAAAALVVGGVAKDPMHAARLAEQSIDSGQAQNKLERLIQITNKK